jgi:hypothetical protein
MASTITQGGPALDCWQKCKQMLSSVYEARTLTPAPPPPLYTQDMYTHIHSIHRLTSGPFGDSMSAAARPKRWGVFRQAKGREFDPSKVEFGGIGLFALLDGAC